jgi:hypothetical protein
MSFKKHSDLKGLHAFLGPSKYHWINYDPEKLSASFSKYLAIQRGIDLHDFARHCIELRRKLPRTKESLNQFVNDAIGFRMVPEQVLFYSINAFGTTDAICFKDDVLRIHDLKTGETPGSIHQLEIYAALFCLEYSKKPEDIKIDLRLYQSDEIIVENPEPEVIRNIMNKIIEFDNIINKIRSEEEETLWLG